MPVKDITTPEEAAVAIQMSAGSKLVVIDWYATWCGPCKAVAPVYAALSDNPLYKDVVFLKADGDSAALKPLAGSLGVAAFPTFMLFKGRTKVAQESDIRKLEALMQEHLTEDRAQKYRDQGFPDGHVNLAEEVNKKDCECLNQASTRTLSAVWADDDSFLESDCDEQLIIQIPFNNPVKLHSLRIRASGGTAPKSLKLFLTQPSLDFDDAESLVPDMELELTRSQLDGTTFIPVKYIKFQNVFHLTVFIGTNQGDEETTRIEYLELVGTSKSGTNMGEFKRVAGKVGERE